MSGSDPLLRLIYASTLSAGVDAQGIEAIIERSSQRNAERGVTGILAIENRKVCQVLEGPQSEVVPLYETIRSDGRHEGVVEIERRAVTRRTFENWAMTRRPMFDVVMVAFADVD